MYTDRIFEYVYEKIRVSYKIENDNIVLIDISPKELWLYEGELTAYRGCPVRKDDIKTRFKLDLLHMRSNK